VLIEFRIKSILFVHLKALRGGELRLVRTVGMVGLDEYLFETLNKNGTNTETTTTSLLQSIVYRNPDTILLSKQYNLDVKPHCLI